MSDAISRKLGAAAWRLRAERLVPWAAWMIAGVATFTLIWRLLAWRHPAWDRGDLPTLLATGLFIAALGTLASWWRPKSVAREWDRRADTKDRFVSWLELRSRKETAASAALAREVGNFSERIPLTGLFRPKLPKGALALILAAGVSLIALERFDRPRQATLAKEQDEARRLLAKAEEIMARQTTDPKLQEELRDTWQKLADSTEPKRDAFRALSELEKKLGDAARSMALTSEENAALAKALAAQNPPTARNPAQGSGEPVAEQMAGLDPEALAQALDEAARHRESARLRDLARQPGQQARETLVRAMNSASALRRAQQAIREAKAGSDDGSSQNNESPSDGPGLAAETQPGRDPGQPGDSSASPRGGGAGSEQDKGTGEDIATDRERLSGSASQDDTLASVAGQGPSRVNSTLLSGDGPGQARGSGETIDQAAIAAALQEVERENIPPGSQILVRRYFESIRPKE